MADAFTKDQPQSSLPIPKIVQRKANSDSRAQITGDGGMFDVELVGVHNGSSGLAHSQVLIFQPANLDSWDSVDSL